VDDYQGAGTPARRWLQNLLAAEKLRDDVEIGMSQVGRS